jgi:hypothetical protein
MAKVLNGVDVDKPIPYSMTLLGAVQALMWKLELETDPEVWRMIKPRLRQTVAAHFGDVIADEALD